MGTIPISKSVPLCVILECESSVCHCGQNSKVLLEVSEDQEESEAEGQEQDEARKTFLLIEKRLPENRRSGKRIQRNLLCSDQPFFQLELNTEPFFD